MSKNKNRKKNASHGNNKSRKNNAIFLAKLKSGQNGKSYNYGQISQKMTRLGNTWSVNPQPRKRPSTFLESTELNV